MNQLHRKLNSFGVLLLTLSCLSPVLPICGVGSDVLQHTYPLAPVLGLCLCLVFGIADLFDADDGRPSILVLGAVLLLGLARYHLVLKWRAGGWAPRLSVEQVEVCAADQEISTAG